MLRALCNYYDCLRRQEDSGLTPYGYSEKNANYNIVLSADGDLVDIIDNTVEKIVGKKTKKVGKSAIFPKRNSVPGIAAETIDHRGKYIFGLDLVVDKETGERRLEVNKNSLLAFRKCKENNLEFTDGMTSEVVEAYRNFMLKWNPEEQTENRLPVNGHAEADSVGHLHEVRRGPIQVQGIQGSDTKHPRLSGQCRRKPPGICL